MGKGKNEVMVGAVEQPGALSFQPAFGLDLVALRAAAVSARVVPHPFHMAFRAGLDMAAQFGGAAAAELARSFIKMRGKFTAGCDGMKALPEDVLNGVCHPHSIIYILMSCASSPCAAGLVQRNVDTLKVYFFTA